MCAQKSAAASRNEHAVVMDRERGIFDARSYLSAGFEDVNRALYGENRSVGALIAVAIQEASGPLEMPNGCASLGDAHPTSGPLLRFFVFT
jgi:hypothetical protein